MFQNIQLNTAKDIMRGVAITTLFLIGSSILIINIFSILFIPVPVLFYRLKLGRNHSSIIFIILFVINIILFGSFVPNIIFFSALLLLGFLSGELIEMNLPIEKVILYASGIVIFISWLFMLIYCSLIDTNINFFISKFIEESIKLTLNIYEKNMKLPEESILVISKSLKQIQYYIIRFWPSIFISLIVFVSWVDSIIIKSVLKEKKDYFPSLVSSMYWKNPKFFVWGVIGCGILVLLPDSSIKIIGLNGIIILANIYFFQGIAIVSFYFQKKKIPLIYKIFLYVLIFIQPLLFVIIIGMGFFDMWLNIRRIIPGKNVNG